MQLLIQLSRVIKSELMNNDQVIDQIQLLTQLS